jgi:hypothetical protein
MTKNDLLNAHRLLHTTSKGARMVKSTKQVWTSIFILSQVYENNRVASKLVALWYRKPYILNVNLIQWTSHAKDLNPYM